MSERKIITTHVHPPIPLRQFDWSAHFDGEEEDGPYGWGKSKSEAIADLLDNVEDDEAFDPTDSTSRLYENEVMK